MDDRLDIRLLGSALETVHRYQSGAVIFREGDEADVAYVVRSGTVEIRYRNRVLDRAGPGVVFGELGLIEQQSRFADAIAASDVSITPMSQLLFFHLIGKQPEFTFTILRLMARRIKARSA